MKASEVQDFGNNRSLKKRNMFAGWFDIFIKMVKDKPLRRFCESAMQNLERWHEGI